LPYFEFNGKKSAGTDCDCCTGTEGGEPKYITDTNYDVYKLDTEVAVFANRGPNVDINQR